MTYRHTHKRTHTYTCTHTPTQPATNLTMPKKTDEHETTTEYKTVNSHQTYSYYTGTKLVSKPRLPNVLQYEVLW